MGKRGLYINISTFNIFSVQNNIVHPVTRANCPSLRDGERTLLNFSWTVYHVLMFSYSSVPHNGFYVLDLQDFSYI